MNAPMPTSTLVWAHCGGALFVREVDDSFTCLMCGLGARAAAVTRRTVEAWLAPRTDASGAVRSCTPSDHWPAASPQLS